MQYTLGEEISTKGRYGRNDIKSRRCVDVVDDCHKMDSAENGQVQNDEKEEDYVEYEIDVYINNSDNFDLYLLQYPLRPKYRPYGDQGDLDSVYVNTFSRCLKQKYAVRTNCENFDASSTNSYNGSGSHNLLEFSNFKNGTPSIGTVDPDSLRKNKNVKSNNEREVHVEQNKKIDFNHNSDKSSNAPFLWNNSNSNGQMLHVLHSVYANTDNCSHAFGIFKNKTLFISVVQNIVQFRPEFKSSTAYSSIKNINRSDSVDKSQISYKAMSQQNTNVNVLSHSSAFEYYDFDNCNYGDFSTTEESDNISESSNSISSSSEASDSSQSSLESTSNLKKKYSAHQRKKKGNKAVKISNNENECEKESKKKTRKVKKMNLDESDQNKPGSCSKDLKILKDKEIYQSEKFCKFFDKLVNMNRNIQIWEKVENVFEANTFESVELLHELTNISEIQQYKDPSIDEESDEAKVDNDEHMSKKCIPDINFLPKYEDFIDCLSSMDFNHKNENNLNCSVGRHAMFLENQNSVCEGAIISLDSNLVIGNDSGFINHMNKKYFSDSVFSENLLLNFAGNTLFTVALCLLYESSSSKLSYASLSKLSFGEQIKIISKIKRIFTFEEVKNILTHVSVSHEKIINDLKHYCHIINGNFVVKSHYTPENIGTVTDQTSSYDYHCLCRDLLLGLFMRNTSMCNAGIEMKVFQNATHLPARKAFQLLNELGVYGLLGWKFRLPKNEEFCSQFSNAVAASESFWRKEVAKVAESIQKMRSDYDKVRSERQNQLCSFEVIIYVKHFLMKKPWPSKKLKKMICIFSCKLIPSSYEKIIRKFTVEIRGLLYLKRIGTPELDKYRKIVLRLVQNDFFPCTSEDLKKELERESNLEIRMPYFKFRKMIRGIIRFEDDTWKLYNHD